MAYGTRDGGGGHFIKTFWPDDTDTLFYVSDKESLEAIIEKVQVKWPGIDMSSITISAEHIQTDCLGYDRYDSMDYTDFLKITHISN